MLKDLRYAVRVLLRSPLFTSVAVLSLALGIGGGVSVFTVLNAIVLRDLPVPNPQQLYAADKHRANDITNRYSWPVFVQARQEIQGRAELLPRPTRPACRSASRAARMPRRPNAAWCNWCQANFSRCCGSARGWGA